jgi:hypothetical protein
MAQNNFNTRPQDMDTNPAMPVLRQREGMPRGQGQPAPMPVARSKAPDTVAIPDSGPHRLSLIYPSPEYGIIKLEKLIPQEVDLSIPFKYTLIITNLTNAMLTNVVLTEMIASSFQF